MKDIGINIVRKMSQEEAYRALKKHPGKWFTIKQVAKELNISTVSTNRNLRMLFWAGMIDSKKVNKHRKKVYRLKEVEEIENKLRLRI